MIQASRLPIILCCAEESEVALVAVVDALHREGYAPEVVPGVETEATLVTAATDRVRGPALFVLCQSDDLDRFQVRRLEGLFSARKGPDHTMITIEVARRGVAAIVTEVRAAARTVGRGAGGRDEDDGRYMRDVVAPTSVAAVPGASIPNRGSVRGQDRDPIARSRATPRSAPPASVSPPPIVQAPEGISDEALGLDVGGEDTDTDVVDPLELHRRALALEPEVQLSTESAAGAPLRAASQDEGPPSDGVPLAVPDDFPMVGQSEDDLEIRGAPGRVGWDHSGPVDIERMARRTRVDPRAESDDRPLSSASTPIHVGLTPPPAAEPAPRQPRGVRVVLLAFALLGMGAVVTMAVLHATAPVGAGPSDHQQRGVPKVGEEGAVPDAGERPPEPPPTTAPTGVEPRAGAAAGSTGEPAAGTEPSGEAGHGTGGDTSEGAPATGSDTSDTTGTSDEDASDGAPTTDPEPMGAAEGDGGSKVVPPPPTGGASPGDALATAIAEGRVRELEALSLLMINTGPSTVTWDDAAARCSRRKVAGLGNWRLPTKGQLVELRRAKVLGPGSYWSRSTVGEDEALVVDAGSGVASPWLKMEPNGRVVCIRPRP